MSCKPVKRGDLTRPWMKRKQAAPRLILPERHLFVTEGTKTEPYYLEGMIDALARKYGNRVKKQFRICPEGSNTLFLLERAEAHLKNDSNQYDHIWIIYDLDDFPTDRFDNVVSRCKALTDCSAGRTWHAIWSNQCFELWFLLHFCPLQSALLREEYRQKLTEQLHARGICQKYEKTDCDLFARLSPHLPDAIRNARSLLDSYPAQTPPSGRNPGTSAHELLLYFQKYLSPTSQKG